MLGTRPEAIKLAPVVLRTRRELRGWRPVIVSTGQQADLVRGALDSMGLQPDCDLRLMRLGQPLSRLTGQCIAKVGQVLRDIRTRLVVVQGDTASAVAGALAAFYEQIPVAHVEAGLRTSDIDRPFPEEANRQIISRVAKLHLAPTIDAKVNLLSEGIASHAIEVTGNTVVDAIEMLRPRIESTQLIPPVPAGTSLVLVTAHRRENLGRPMVAICNALRELADTRTDLHIVFVMHPNPAARATAEKRLARQERIILCPPLPYLQLLRLMSNSRLILTDSGGLQEEAPSFGRPVLVLRDKTERTEGLLAGCALLVGTAAGRIVSEVERLLDDQSAYDRLTPHQNPYGDGQAAVRIVRSLAKLLGLTTSGSRGRVAAVGSRQSAVGEE